jgi:hypothetical protein
LLHCEGSALTVAIKAGNVQAVEAVANWINLCNSGGGRNGAVGSPAYFGRLLRLASARTDEDGPAVAELLLTALAPPTLFLSPREALSRDPDGNAPLHHLLQHGTAKALAAFLTKLSTPHASQSSIDGSFHYESETDFRRRYTHAGMGVSTVWSVLTQEANGKSPLHWAIDRGPATTQQLLDTMVEHGEQIGLTEFWNAMTAKETTSKMTPLNYAFRPESLECAAAVFDVLDMLHGNVEGVRTLLLTCCRAGFSLLHGALQAGDASLLKRVLWHGARFAAEFYTRGCHWTPRMFA